MKYISIIIIGLLFLLTQCKESKIESTEESTQKFIEHISSFSSGVISNSSDIVIKFTEELDSAKLNTQTKLITLSPKVKGRTYWEDSKTLIFSPEESLKSNQEYSVKLALSKLIEVPSELKEFQFNLKTRKQDLSLTTTYLEQGQGSNQILNGQILTADNANSIDIEKTVTVNQGGSDLDIVWEHLPDGTTHNFKIDKITRKESKTALTIECDGSAIGVEKEERKVVTIPAKSSFELLNMDIDKGAEQRVTLYFSDNIDRSQDLTGLVHFSNKIGIRFSIDGTKLHIYPQKNLTQMETLFIEIGIKSDQDTKSKTRYHRTVNFGSLKPQIKAIGKGVILPNSNGLIFPFRSANLSGVNVKIIKIFEDNIGQFLQRNSLNGSDYLNYVGSIVHKESIKFEENDDIDLSKWNNFSLDLSKMIKVDPGAIYRVIIDFDMSQSLYPIDKDDIVLPNIYSKRNDPDFDIFDDPNRSYYSYIDRQNHYYDGYRSNWRDREDPTKITYYMNGDKGIRSNILASDLGIIVKNGDRNQLTVVVTDLVTTESINNVEIEIYNLQNRVIATGRTDSDGICKIDLNSKPFLLIAKDGDQRGYLKLDDGSSLSLSSFDTEGEKAVNGIKGFIYGERGVWRPGDSIFVSFILEDKNSALPKDLPVIFELSDPEGKLYQRKIKTSSVNNLYDFRTKTEADDKTGNWIAKVNVGGSIFTKVLKIETVKPNRLKVQITQNSTPLKFGSNSGDLKATWLHGAKAKGLKADVTLKLFSTKTVFKNYPKFTFDDPSKSFESEEKLIFDGSVDDDGKADLLTEIRVSEEAPGMLNAQFKSRVFEAGGDFSTDISSCKYSPFKSYVGVKVPEGRGWNGAIYSNEINTIPIVTVDENGDPVSRKKVKIEVFEIYWRWWWDHSSNDNLAHYVSNKSKYLIKTDYVNTVNGKVDYNMDLDSESWGRKLIKVTDPISGHSTGEMFYTTYKGWWSSDSDSPGGAEMLSFTTDKKNYSVGEDVEVILPISEKGRALISLEKGSEVLETFWVDVDKENSRFKFKVNSDMTPNIFIHISYIQPHNHQDNDLPIRLYGVQPIFVEDPATILHPEIVMPDKLRPEKEVTIEVKERDGKNMTYTVAVVDEGLLDLTRFKTPSPWERFYRKEGLGVKTWDLYKYVIGAFSGKMAGLLAIGGDEYLKNGAKQKANRFKPVVKFLGPFELRSGTNSHTFTMPNYVGSVRTMVVAAENGAYGSAEKATPVKNPLMVIATLPRVVGPTESVKLPVTIFAMESNIKKVKVEVKSNNLLTISGAKQKTVLFTEEGEQTTYFDIGVKDLLGIAKVQVIATCGKERAVYDIELDVRVPNPRITKVTSAIAEPNKSWKGSYKSIGLAGTNRGKVEISSIPPLNLEQRLTYLMQYPHGCVEQTTSSVFPQLYLNKLVKLNDDEKLEIEKNIKAGIDRLKRFQIANGGLSYWPSSGSKASEWGTSYAGHFMLEAKAEGYNLPVGFLKSWTKFQSQSANNWNTADYDSESKSHSHLIQAYRLYTLALAGSPSFGAMNRMKEMKYISNSAKWRLAAAYSLAGQKQTALSIIGSLTTTVESYRELSNSYGSDTRDLAMILETLTLLKDNSRAKGLVKQIADQLSSNRWLSTQSTAYSLLSISKFIGESDIDSDMHYSIEITGQDPLEVQTASPISQVDIDIEKFTEGDIKIGNNSSKTLFIRVITDGIPLAGNEVDQESNLNMTVTYRGKDGGAIDVKSIAQGVDFIAKVEIVNPGIKGDYNEMALTQIFPSGWEIHNIRMESAPQDNSGSTPDYQDIRDDRVLSYFDLKRNKKITLEIQLNAAYVGKYYLPATSCEAMYDNEISAQVAGMWVEVVKVEK